MLKVRDIAAAIETYAPLRLQESYDNAGLQVGNPEHQVSAILLCLDVTEEILREALKRECNMIVSHHPLIFRGLKNLTGADQTQRIVMEALSKGISIYSAHTNLDIAYQGVSYEMAHKLGLKDLSPLVISESDPSVGLGVIGATSSPTPKLEFLRKVKDAFGVKSLRYSAQSKGLVVRNVAICGGSGASFIKDAVAAGADVYITGDVKYHDFTTYADDIVLADIGHYEGELCCRELFQRILVEAFPEAVVYMSESESNPIKFL
ncbi:MAG: Nif3-like dinuclear metal center hexameric protein [Muribaculum sp.]|nr:Nif3-like dinuclear metal center hexameric protein [Muribaculum sp.]